MHNPEGILISYLPGTALAQFGKGSANRDRRAKRHFSPLPAPINKFRHRKFTRRQLTATDPPSAAG